MSSAKIGKFIQTCRKDKNLTQEELGERLGVSSKSISRWENNITMPDISIVSALARELDVEISELLNGEKMSEPDLEVVKNIVNKVIKYSNYEEKIITKYNNKNLIVSFILMFIATLNNIFDILKYFFDENISSFVTDTLLCISLILNIVWFYNNKKGKDFKVDSLTLSSKNSK